MHLLGLGLLMAQRLRLPLPAIVPRQQQELLGHLQPQGMPQHPLLLTVLLLLPQPLLLLRQGLQHLKRRQPPGVPQVRRRHQVVLRLLMQLQHLPRALKLLLQPQRLRLVVPLQTMDKP
jgi:hypothetical protein